MGLADRLDIDRRVMTLGLARMVDSFGNSFLVVVLPLYIASGVVSGEFFGLTTSLIIGIILSMFGFFNSIGQPFAGRLSDRMGKRKEFVLAGLGILAVATFTYTLVDSYTSVIVIRAVQGLGVALTIPAVIALVDEYAGGAGRRGGNMGTYNTFRLIGFGGGPVVSGVVLAAAPYTFTIAGFTLEIAKFESAFYIAALGTLISFVLVGLFVYDPEETEATAADELEISIFSHDAKQTLDPVFTLAVASLFVAIGIALLTTLEPEVNARLDQGATLFGIEFAAFVVSQAVLQIPIGSASDRYGRKPFIFWGLVLLIPATLAQGLVTEPWEMIIARLAQGVGGAMEFAPALALAGDFAKKGQSGTTLSLITMTFGLGVAIGPLAAGYLIRFGYTVPFAFGAALVAVGAVLVATQVYDPEITSDESTPSGQSAPQD
ncbi:MAG TPA: MFS transporter [Halococcus sp.]|nr:MFS transporter [Halococcus sp.]